MDLHVLRVVVASPGDVKAEREIVPRVIDEVNRNIARPRGLHIDLYRWETDSHPGFHPLGPQGLIDPKLKIEDCDLLIGIFWRRFGTPVSDAKSGTEHEFRIAYSTWKETKSKPQIFVYFSQRAYTPKSKEETDQWGLVLQFREDFPKEGLWWDYKSKTQFEQFLRNHLTQFLNEMCSSPASAESIAEERVLDAAFPSHVLKDRGTELLVLIRLPDSPGLKGMLAEDSEAEARAEDVRSKPFRANFPLGPDNKPQPLKVNVSVTSPDFSPPGQTKNLFVLPRRDSEVCTFILTPIHAGRLTILVELRWEDATQGERVLKTECVSEATSLPAKTGMCVAHIPFAVSGDTGPAPPPAPKSTGGPGMRDAPTPVGGSGDATAGLSYVGPARTPIDAQRQRLIETLKLKANDLYEESRCDEALQLVELAVRSFPDNADLLQLRWSAERAKQEMARKTAPPAPLTSLFQLPQPSRDFTGREPEIHELRDAIERGEAHFLGLQGQGGVGKTALALKLAAELSPKFPDAQVYLDLKGVSDKPLTAAEALAHVVRSFHPEAKLPEKEDDLRPLYNGALQGKRALLLMDNARDAAQVRPLVPPPGCALLVTSRNHFYFSGLRTKDLDSLPPKEAVDLLLRVAPRTGADAEPIARLCGYLPQALVLAAKALAERRDLSPAKYRERLADAKHRVEVLDGGDKGVAASITLSYNLLDGDTQKRWRVLGVFPDTFDTPAAAAVWEVEGEGAQESLSRLLQFSMLEWDEDTGRYRLHDLMRAFACGRVSDAEREPAARRHCKHYADVLGAANQLYSSGGESILRGLASFDLEWGNIEAGQAWAAEHAKTDIEAAKLCSDYSDRGTSVLYLRQHPGAVIRWRAAALESARMIKDRRAEGSHLGNLGAAHHSLGNFRGAIEYHKQFLTIARDVCDRKGEGQALGNLGSSYRSLGDYRQAIECHEQHLAIAREIGDRKGEGQALGNLGSDYYCLRDYQRAIGYYELRLTITREIGHRRGEGDALSGLGISYYSLGDYHRAIEYQEQSLHVAHEIGDRQGEGNVLGNLGIAYCSLGDYRRAIEYQERRLAIASGIGDRLGEGNAHWNMSLALDKLGQRRNAIACAEAALQTFEQIESPTAGEVRSQLEAWRRES